MTLDEAMDKIRTEYGTALDALGLELVVVGHGENSFYMHMDRELLDRMTIVREINARFAEAALGDLANWKPTGVLPLTSQSDTGLLTD
jgi:hypothetical protein